MCKYIRVYVCRRLRGLKATSCPNQEISTAATDLRVLWSKMASSCCCSCPILSWRWLAFGFSCCWLLASRVVVLWFLVTDPVLAFGFWLLVLLAFGFSCVICVLSVCSLYTLYVISVCSVCSACLCIAAAFAVAPPSSCHAVRGVMGI